MNSEQREAAVRDGIVRHLRANLAAMLMTGSALALIVVFVMRSVVPLPLLLGWCAVVVVWNVSRQFLFARYLNRPESGIPARTWILVFSVTTTISGMFWGIGGVALFPPYSPPHQVFLAFILGGVIAGIVGNYSSHLPTFFAYAAVVMLPLISRFLYLGDEMSLVMGGTLVIYLVTVSALVINVNKSILRSIRLTVDNRGLVDDLLRTQERYDLSLRGANDGIWDWDISGNRLYASPRLAEMFGELALKEGDPPERFLDAIHPDDRDDYVKAVVAHLKGETPYLNHEFRLKGTEGENARWMLNRGLALIAWPARPPTLRDGSRRIGRCAMPTNASRTKYRRGRSSYPKARNASARFFPRHRTALPWSTSTVPFSKSTIQQRVISAAKARI